MLNTIDYQMTDHALAFLPQKENNVQASAPREIDFTYPLKECRDVRTEAKQAVSYLQELKFAFTEYEQLQGKANTALYKMLGGVFLVVARLKFAKAKMKKADAKALLDTFELLLEERKANDEIKFTAATSLETKILRFVCGPMSVSREKAWTRVLKVALKVDEIRKNETSFAVWLASEGGVYEVANSSKSGVKPSERDAAHVAEAEKLIEQWHGTDVFEEVQQKVQSKLKAPSEQFAKFTVTLKHYQDDGEISVLELSDEVAVQRMLLLLGKQIDSPVREREVVEAEEAARIANFTSITGYAPEYHRI